MVEVNEYSELEAARRAREAAQVSVDEADAHLQERQRIADAAGATKAERQRAGTASEGAQSLGIATATMERLEAAIVDDYAAAPGLYLEWRRAMGRWFALAVMGGGEQPRVTLPAFNDVVVRVMARRGDEAHATGRQDAAAFQGSIE